MLSGLPEAPAGQMRQQFLNQGGKVDGTRDGKFDVSMWPGYGAQVLGQVLVRMSP